MFENILQFSVAKWEMERLYSTPAWRHRAALVRSRAHRHLLTDLAAVGSRILLTLGSALTTAGERLSDGRPAGRSATI
jgi:hypothetical protein